MLLFSYECRQVADDTIKYIYMRHFESDLSFLTLPLANDRDTDEAMDTSADDDAIITRSWLKTRLPSATIDELRQLPSFIQYAFAKPNTAPKLRNTDSEATRTDKLLDFVEFARGLKDNWVRNMIVGVRVITRMMLVWNKKIAEEVLLAMVLESKSKGEDDLENSVDELCKAIL